MEFSEVTKGESMIPHFKSPCLLGAIFAFGLWACDDNSSNPAGTLAVTSSANVPDSSRSEFEGSRGYDDGPQSSSSSEISRPLSPGENLGFSSSTENVASSSSANILTSSSSKEELISSSAEMTETPSVKKSTGCGKSLDGISTGYFQIESLGKARDYAIDIPENYDPNKPYKLFYASHWFGGSAKDVVNGNVTNGGAENWAFFGLKRMAKEAGEQAIFIAPNMNGTTWDLTGTGEDHALFSTLTNYAKENLCIDESRVFAVGFSFGAMMTYSLSLVHQDVLRAVATLAAVNYVGSASSAWIPYPADSKKKIAYLGITGMSDGTCPFAGDKDKKLGGIFAAALHAEDNGCTVPSDPTTIDKTYAGSKTHVIYDFKDCDDGYPVKYATFDGGHIAAPTDGQTSDDGLNTWAPRLMWDFFSQF